MPENSPHHAFGSPGKPARWTSSAKVGVGTAYHTACCAWFTLSHGIVDEIYYPTVDTPNTRDLQLLITDGRTFCHEEKRDLDHRVERPDADALFYRLISTDRKGRYQIIKEVLTDPHRPVLLTRVQLKIRRPALRGRLKVYALLSPHIGGQGADNEGKWCELSTGDLLHAQRAGTHLVFGCSLGFSRRSVGYVGSSDGWKDLRNFKMDWEFREAGPGNIALMGEVALGERTDFVIGVGFGQTDTSAVTALLQSFATPFPQHHHTFVEQWRRADRKSLPRPKHLTALERVSRLVLLAHEDKIFQGAMVASLSIPWGEIKGDDAKGGYHLVWTRDLVQSASALLATGQTATALRALIWLAAVQTDDGGVPQNSWTNGEPFQTAVQLDETASLLLLASRLRQARALEEFNPWKVLKKSAAYLIKSGPVTPQERWEQNPGYSPSTLAAVVAGLIGTADFAMDADQGETRDFLLAYADWLNAHIEDWTVTQTGRLHPKIKRHYLFITPADPKTSVLQPDPENAEIDLANHAGRWKARDIVSADFLQLVRLGLRRADDPLVIDSLAVVDRCLRKKLNGVYGWRRYCHDAYGQKADGSPYDGRGVGRCWPLLAGERGHHAIALGRNPQPYLRAMEASADAGFLLPEQVWDDANSHDGSCRLGAPTGAAMPLCWSHAEYLTLRRSAREGRVFDRIDAAYHRYAGQENPRRYVYEFWSLRYRRPLVRPGKILRVIGDSEASLHFADSQGASGRVRLQPSGLTDLWFADLPTGALPPGESIQFGYLGLPGWEGITFKISIQKDAPQAALNLSSHENLPRRKTRRGHRRKLRHR